MDRRARRRPEPLSGARWIWFTNDDAANNLPAMTRYLRATVTLPPSPPRRRLLFTVDDEAVVFVNGTQVIDTKALRDNDENAWQKAQHRRRPRLLQAGANTIAVQVKNRLNPSGGADARAASSPACRPAARRSTPSSAWKSSATGPAGWEQPGFDDSAWTPARELATYGCGPWGGNVTLPPQPSPYLRKDFTADQADRAGAPVRLRARPLRGPHQRPQGRRRRARARLDGVHQARPDARPTTSRTSLKTGDNAIGAILGEGWYAGRLQGGRKWGTNPALRAQLKITYADGTTTRVEHRRHAGRPAAAACAPRASTTARPTTPASTSPAGTSPASTAAGRTRSSAPRRWRSSPTRRRRSGSSDARSPRRSPSPSPAPTIYDLGQNFAGWARLAAQGAAGTHGQAALRRDPQRRTARSTPPTCAPRCRPTRYTLEGTGHRDLRAALHLPRLPLRRGHRVPRHADARHARRPRGHAPTCPSYGTFTSSQPAREPDPERDPLGPALELPGRPDRRLPARRAPRLDR